MKGLEITYDKVNRPIRIAEQCDGTTLVTEKKYDKLSRVIEETDACQNKTRFEYDALGRIIATYYPDGGVERKEYDPLGNIIKEIDPEGYETKASYNLFGEPLSKDFPDGSQETFTYHPTGTVSAYTDANGHTTFYTYDLFDRILTTHAPLTTTTWTAFNKHSETDDEGITTFYTYDFAGRKTSEKTAYKTSTYTYDSLGRLSITQEEDTLYAQEYDLLNNLLLTKTLKGSTLQAQEEYLYDAHNNCTHVINSQGVIETLYNSLDKPICIKDPLGFITQFSYCYKNAYTQTVTNPKGIQTITIHDACGREAVLLKKNPQSRLKTILKPDGSALMHAYDTLGRLSHYYGPDFDYQYTYDHKDRVISVYDGISKKTTTRSYDALGCILQETLANGLTLTNTYDTRSRRVKLTLPDFSQIDYNYDGIYLSTVSRGSFTHKYTHNLEGQLIHAESPLGELQIERDALGRYQNYSAPHYSAQYAYDSVGNLIAETTNTYAYDDLDQLIQENEHTYLCDSLNNRLKKDNSDYKINHLNQVLHDGQTNYVYDLNGNLISDGIRKYTYDSLDRLIAVEHNKKRTTYTYDPFHRRLTKNEIRYIWDGDNEIGTVDTRGKIQELRILGEGLGAEIGSAVLYELKVVSHIPIHDHRGCVVSLTNLTTKQTESYRYSAFGEELGANKLSPWRFSSKRVDDETGLIFFGRRYYNPELGRWMTQDPQGFDDGPNLYAYLHHSPITVFDLYGLFSWESAWNGTKEFGWNGLCYLGEMGCGIGHSMSLMGEWMYADFQYEFFNDSSYFNEKAQRATDGWGAFGRAAYNDPLGTIAPGIMDAWHNPTSPGAWRRATVDLAMLACTAAKVGRIGNVGKIGRIGEELSAFNKAGNLGSEALKVGGLESPTRSASLKPLGLGSTGRSIPLNLSEQLAMKEIMSNPSASKIIITGVNDARWSGWDKMMWHHGNIKIHYLGKWENGVLKSVDDFKFVSN